MLNKQIKISSYNEIGKLVEQEECDEVPFNKNGTMTVGFSKMFNRMLKKVEKGGAMFIERIWKNI